MQRLFKHITSILFILWAFPALADGHFDFSPEVRVAYEKIISLEFESAKRDLAQIKKNDPENLIIHHLENYMDFFRIFIDENEEDFKRLSQNQAARLKKVKAGDKKSPYYLFVQAEINLQWALARLKFEEYVTAFGEVNRAIGLLEKNQRKFPNFIANKKSLSALHAIVGTIPDNYKGVLEVVSNFNGSIDQGTKEIKEVLQYASQNDFVFEKEAIAIYALILSHLKNDKEEAWHFLRKSNLDVESNPLASFLVAGIAHRAGHNDDAIEILEKRHRSMRQYPMYYLDFMLGSFKLNRLDTDADIYLRSFLNYFFGRNGIKEAYQKLAWHEWIINQDEQAYRLNMQYCLKRGKAQIDEDKQAVKEAEKQILPDRDLLKARLLFDGGYFIQAYHFMIPIEKNYVDDPTLELDYNYRMARICHQSKNYFDALEYYNRAIALGTDSRSYMACNAALNRGYIFEESGQQAMAKKNYKLCLSLNPTTYKNSLHQKAKAGLNRLDD